MEKNLSDEWPVKARTLSGESVEDKQHHFLAIIRKQTKLTVLHTRQTMSLKEFYR